MYVFKSGGSGPRTGCFLSVTVGLAVLFFLAPVRADSSPPEAPIVDPLVQGEGFRLKSIDFFKKSIEAFKTALKNPQTELAARRNLAKIFFQLGDYPQAISHWRKLLEKDPDNEAARKQLGIAYGKNNDLQQAPALHQKLPQEFQKLINHIRQILSSS